jgi:hypothetical protein
MRRGLAVVIALVLLTAADGSARCTPKHRQCRERVRACVAERVIVACLSQSCIRPTRRQCKAEVRACLAGAARPARGCPRPVLDACCGAGAGSSTTLPGGTTSTTTFSGAGSTTTTLPGGGGSACSTSAECAADSCCDPATRTCCSVRDGAPPCHVSAFDDAATVGCCYSTEPNTVEIPSRYCGGQAPALCPARCQVEQLYRCGLCADDAKLWSVTGP